MHAGFVLRAQEALRRGDTHGEHLVTLFLRELQVPLLLQHRHEARQGRQEPFGTDIVCRLPRQKERLLHRWTVLGQTTALNGLLTVLTMVEQPDGRLAALARPFHKGIQQERVLGWGCLLVARSQIPEQRAPGLKAG